MKPLIHRIAIVIALLAASVATLHATKPADVVNVHVQNRTRYVSDMANVMSASARQQADSLLAQMWRETSAEPVVVIVPNLDGADENDYATDLFKLWGIGKNDKDNGVLMLISIDDRRAVIRTGYGAEGVLPDAICATILRNDLFPRFRQADYDGGILASLTTMAKVMTSDEAREELMSAQANDANAAADDTDEFFSFYLGFCAMMAMVMLIVVVVNYSSARKRPTAQAYSSLQTLWLPSLVVAVLSLGMALPVFLMLVLMMRHVRLHKRLCPNCATRMKRVDEENDNLYLTPSQDAEEMLNSVDYDVWLCPNCNETDIIPYVNRSKAYAVCPQCSARAATLVTRRTIQAPTVFTEGRGVEIYQCLNCRQQWHRPYSIAKLPPPPPVIINGGRGGGNGFGGGGFGGGSFGGGSTGGGGASGGW